MARPDLNSFGEEFDRKLYVGDRLLKRHEDHKSDIMTHTLLQVILRLGIGIPGLEGEIDKLKSAPIDPRREAELQEMIIDLRRRAECAQELTARLERLELNQANRFERLESSQTRLTSQQTDTRGAVEDIREKLEESTSTQEKNQQALMEQLQKIVKNPFLQLPNPGDFASNSGIVSQSPTSFHYENKREYTQKDDKSGLRFVARYQQMLTKGTVAALEQQDFEDLSRIIGSDWASVALHLDLSEGQINRIKTSFARNDIPAIISEVIRIWGDMEKETATILRLIQAMLDCPMMSFDESAFEDIIKRHMN